MRKLLLLVTALILAATPGAASAHALLLTRTPAANAVLPRMPGTVRTTWSEPVTGDATALIGLCDDGLPLLGPAIITGADVLAPVIAVPHAGRCAYAARITSADGHHVAVASAFAVAVGTPRAARTLLVLSGHRLPLSGARVGERTLRLWGGLQDGTVRWTSELLPAPLIWTFRRGVARGLLPFPGTYDVEVRARVGAFGERIATGTTEIAP